MTRAAGGWRRWSPIPPWALTVLALALATVAADPPPGWWVAGALLAPMAAAATLRTHPPLAMAICAGTGVVTGLALDSAVPLWSAALGAALFVISLLAGRHGARPRPAPAVLGVAAVAGTAYGVATGRSVATGLLVLALAVAVPWALGRTRRQQDQLALLGLAQARLQERARIARDMHDTLGHDLSLLALRAAALELAPDLGERHRATAAELRIGAAAATARLAEIITVLRDGGPAPLVPAGDRITDLVDRARQAGVAVTLRDDSGGDLPEPVDRAAYRVVQEALTNAVKHAPAAPVRIDLSTAGGTTTVTVTNPLPSARRRGPGSRAGLDGLHERVRLIGGTVSTGARGDLFEVVAALPHRGAP
ncbi:sensor histidine kinase [Catellatospora methionotrophica]|uniref:sensor histidine kinase n=1 Tax=Catellatospora methionotrophica TaxID=121620 RepID=UPI001408CD34|nr:histidine kinase [Catellatospora methionotrophica]